MTDESSFDKLRFYVNYYAFWSWEYQRRNPLYIQSYKKLEESGAFEKNNINAIIEVGHYLTQVRFDYKNQFKEFIKEHNRFPRDPDDGFSGEQLLEILKEEENKDEDISNVNFVNNSIENIPDLDFLALKYLDFSVILRGRKHPPSVYNKNNPFFPIEIKNQDDFESYLLKLKHFNLLDEHDSVSFEFDPEQDYRVLSPQMEFLYMVNKHHSKTCPFQDIILNSEKESEREIIEAYYSSISKKLNFSNFLSKTKQIFARAVGLFLYDFKKEYNLNESENDKLKQALTNKFDSGYDYAGVCNNFLKNTEKCINEIYLHKNEIRLYNMLDGKY